MAAITVLKGDNVPHGPYNRAQIGEQLSRGEISPTSLAFVEGLTEWTPLRDVLAKVDAANPPPVVAPPVSTVPIGTGYGPTGPMSAGTSTPIGTGYSYAVTMQPPEHLVYAGFWLRAAALLVDSLVLMPLFLVYLGVEMFVMSTNDDTMRVIGSIALFVAWLAVIIGQWLYFALQESSAAQATVGKRLLGLQVTDRMGGRIRFGRASGRYFGKIISALALYIGFMMAGWTERKQALHDMMADTLVVRKPKV